MRNRHGLALLAALLALPASADEKTILTSVGYSYLHYLEEGEKDSSLGGYLSVASARRGIGLDLDLAYHRNKYEPFVIHTVTAGLGPRVNFASGTARPFVHILAAARHDSAAGGSDTHFGGMAGGGVDVPAGSKIFVHLGADFEMFLYDGGGRFKMLRLAAGVAF
jgi:hypothetical protein